MTQDQVNQVVHTIAMLQIQMSLTTIALIIAIIGGAIIIARGK
jgi:hypothetical protein